MRHSFLKIIISLFLFFSFLTPLLVLAQITIDNPLKADTLEDLIDNIINFIFWVATALAPLLIVIAGFYFITAAGDPGRIQTAKNIILYTVIGYGIILLSKGLILVLKEVLGA